MSNGSMHIWPFRGRITDSCIIVAVRRFHQNFTTKNFACPHLLLEKEQSQYCALTKIV